MPMMKKLIRRAGRALAAPIIFKSARPDCAISTSIASTSIRASASIGDFIQQNRLRCVAAANAFGRCGRARHCGGLPIAAMPTINNRGKRSFTHRPMMVG